MPNVISVKFNPKGKIYFFDPRGMNIETDSYVIVETAKGQEYGQCVYGNHEVREDAIVPPLRPVVRPATEEDGVRAEYNRALNTDAFERCREKIEEFRLPMKLVSAEHSFDGSEITFFFTAEGRVDFRELQRELHAVFKTRIWLRQIGVRDEAKMLGGMGICGRQFCCTQFLGDFQSVSIKMAKNQGLSLNPVKISGSCGKLMCCLKYEEDAYDELNKRAPKVDAFVETPGGKGSIISVNLLRGTAKVRLEDGNDTTLKTFGFDELDVLGGKSRRAEYQTAKAEGRLEEAGFKPSVIAPPPKPAVERFHDAVTPRASAPRPEPVKKSRGHQPPKRDKHERHTETPPKQDNEKVPKRRNFRRKKP